MDILDHKWEFYKANLFKNILYGYCENVETNVELNNHFKILMCTQISIQKGSKFCFCDKEVNEYINVRVYAKNFNILRIMSGMGSLAYTN